MQEKVLWLPLLLVALVLALFYLIFTLFPGKIDPLALNYFSRSEIIAGRNYHKINQLIVIASLTLEITVLFWLVTGSRAGQLERWSVDFSGGNRLLAVGVFFLSLWLLLRLVNLPFSLYSGYYLQHQWGFSTQTLGAWWLDYLKGGLLELILSGTGVLLLFWATGRWPNFWWLVAGAFTAVWILIQGYLWPVLIAPHFNNFEPVKDPQVIQMVERLAARADLRIDSILVMDASRRTTMANAYFTGLGSTKRIVLYDTLLNNYPLDEVEAVIAHEMAHWKKGHVLKGNIAAMAGSLVTFFLLYLVLRYTLPLPLKGIYPPRAWLVILLFTTLLSLVTSPLQAGLSRSMEREADQVSVEITQNPSAAVRLQVDLAKKNLADVSPAPFVEWFSYSHPSTLKRIKLLQAAE